MESQPIVQTWKIHRLGLADLLDGAWDVFLRRPWDFLLLGAIPVAVRLLLPVPPERPQPAELAALLGQTAIFVLFGTWASIAMIVLADRSLANEPYGAVRSLLVALRSIVQVLLTGALWGVLLIVPLTIVFTLVLGVVAMSMPGRTPEPALLLALAIGLGVVLGIPFLAALTRLYFFEQVVVLRGRWGWSALAGSARVVHGRFWRAFGFLLVLMIPSMLLALLTALLPHSRLVQAIVWLPTIPLGPFVTLCTTLFFLNLEAVRTAPGHPGTAPAPASVSPSEPGGPMKILVLGGGAQGRVIANDIAARLPRASVTVADVRDPRLPARPNLAWREADCSAFDTVVRLMGEHDLAVGALPSRYGFAAMKAAIEARRNLVDVSFCAEDALTLNAAARAAGIAIVPDAGLAPGISNLLAGEAYARRGAPLDLLIMVGGVAQDRSKPYGYCVTWSLDDLTEEYIRPARIVRGGEKVVVPVFSGLEHVEVEGVGTMEAFYSDGLRSLMDTLPGVPEMGEKTLRWPGHVEAVQPLVAAGRLAEELRACCTLDPPEDLVALVVRLRWSDGEELTTLVDRYDPASGLTAMSRTTALTTAVTAQMLASGLVPPPGVQPLERVAADPKAFRIMVDGLAAHGVRLDRGRI